MLGDGMRRRQGGAKSAATGKGRADGGTAKSGRTRGRRRERPVRWGVVIPATIAALLLPFAIGYALAVYVMFPETKAESIGGIEVPDLTGRTVADAEDMLSAAGLGGLDTLVVPHPTADPGYITAQDPLPGQQLRAGAGVSVSVSSGRPRVIVPDVQNLSASAATVILDRLGFEVRTVEVSDAMDAGRVLRIEPAAGSAVRLPATITLTVSTGPLPADTLPQFTPDTTPSIGAPPLPGGSGRPPQRDTLRGMREH
jgi:serine/threonine-protein kinase